MGSVLRCSYRAYFFALVVKKENTRACGHESFAENRFSVRVHTSTYVLNASIARAATCACFVTQQACVLGCARAQEACLC